MSSRTFLLEPFTKADFSSGLALTGRIARQSSILAISYLLRGRMEDLAIPVTSDSPSRRNALWENTCFELFAATKDGDEYWEFNLSPAGHWNIYRFASYRRGMEEETAFESLPFMVSRKAGSLSLDLAIDLKDIIPLDQSPRIGVSAVIKSSKGEVSHWALFHGGPHADFHRRDGFVIELR
jgi:hypothetical protein